MSDWHTGTPTAPGLYLVIEKYGDESMDALLRGWDGQHWIGASCRPRPMLWLPFPYPPGYGPATMDMQMVVKQP